MRVLVMEVVHYTQAAAYLPTPLQVLIGCYMSSRKVLSGYC